MDGRAWWAAAHGVVGSRTQLSNFTFTFHFHALEKEMATHSSILAWRIPGMGEPGGLPSMGSHRVGHDWSDLAAAIHCKCYVNSCQCMENWYSFLELSEIFFQYFPSEFGCFYGYGTGRYGGPTVYSLTYALVGRTLVYRSAKQPTWSTMSLNLMLSKAMVDQKGGWAPKNLCFWTVVLEKTLESPSHSKEVKPVNPKGNQPWILIVRTDAEAEAPRLWPPDAKSWLIGKDPDAGKDWRQEEKGMTEDEMVRCYHQFNGCELEQIPVDGEGQGILACCSPWGLKELDMTEPLGNKSNGRGLSAPPPPTQSFRDVCTAVS